MGNASAPVDIHWYGTQSAYLGGLSPRKLKECPSATRFIISLFIEKYLYTISHFTFAPIIIFNVYYFRFLMSIIDLNSVSTEQSEIFHTTYDTLKAT